MQKGGSLDNQGPKDAKQGTRLRNLGGKLVHKAWHKANDISVEIFGVQHKKRTKIRSCGLKIMRVPSWPLE